MLAPDRFAHAYLADIHRCLDAIPLDAVNSVVECLDRASAERRQVFVFGNGGSAATAAHLVCDLRRSVGSRRPARTMRVTALCDNIATLTSLANDCGYERVFSAQLEGSLEPGDVVIAISASGNSANILNALAVARDHAAITIGLLGFGGGRARRLVDIPIVIDSHEYGQVEDLHLMVGHLVCACLRQQLAVAVS